MIRVAIADDQTLVRSGFASLLDDVDDVVVVGEAADGEAAVRIAQQVRPDVFLMDIRMPGVDGLEATRRIVADPACREVRVVVLTTFELDEYVFAALRAGASGFLTKDVDADDLRQAIRLVAAGHALLSPSVTRTVVDAFAAAVPEPKRRERLDLLTEREVEVLRLVARAMTNAEIAERLVLTEATVKSHVSAILRKLGLRDRVQAVVAAYDAGLVRPHTS